MGKSIYETYAEEKQEEVLKSTKTLQEAIEVLKYRKEHFRSVYYEASCETIADLFNLSYDEIDKAVDGEKYWIV